MTQLTVVSLVVPRRLSDRERDKDHLHRLRRQLLIRWSC